MCRGWPREDLKTNADLGEYTVCEESKVVDSILLIAFLNLIVNPD